MKTYVLDGFVNFLHAILARFGSGGRIRVILNWFIGALNLLSVQLHVVHLK